MTRRAAPPSSPPDHEYLWSNEGMRRHLHEFHHTLQKLRHLADIQNKSDEHVKEVDACTAHLNTLALPLKSVHFSRFAHHTYRTAAKRRWRLRRRERSGELQAGTSIDENSSWDQEFVEWREQADALRRLQQRQSEREQSERAARMAATSRQRQTASRIRLAEMLEQLLTLRKQRWIRKGHVFVEDDGVFMRALAESAETVPVPSSLEARPQSDEEDTREERAPVQGDIAEWYTRGSRSLDKLLEIRRQWDEHLVSQGRGSRIPPHLVVPPLPSSHLWAAWIRPAQS